MRTNGIRARAGLFAALIALLGASPAALRAQQNGTDDEAREAAAIARADSLRAALVQPEGTKHSPAATLARLPFQVFTGAIGVVAGAGYGVYKLLDNLGIPNALRLANRDLEDIGIKVRPDFIGQRSGLALSARWDGGGTPLFLEGGYSMRGYQLARGGLFAGDTLNGFELAAGHHRQRQIRFWGVGMDAPLASEADYGWTRRDLSGAAWVGLSRHVRLGAEGGWEENTGERGTDQANPDVQDRFATSLPFGATGTERFGRAKGSLDLDFTWIGPTYRQMKGVRLITSLSAYRGLDDTDSEFRIGSGDLRVYVPISRQHAFAIRGLAHEVFGEEGSGVPIYYLPRLGSSDGLRGQKGWRYRDRSVLAGMAEWRYQVWWHPGDPNYRLDAFVFADHGAVGPSLGAIEWADFKTTPGFGLRFMDGGVGKAETYVAFRGDTPRVGLKFGRSF
jgi:hypothetical protein